jgi:ELWxxDGT repeat protein
MQLKTTFLSLVLGLFCQIAMAQLKAELVKDINSTGNAIALPSQGANPIPQLFVYKDKFYFAADDGINGGELWVSDGTKNGTSMVKDINVGSNGSFPEIITIFKDKMLIMAREADNERRLFLSDGTNTGTTLLYNGKIRSDLITPQAVEYQGNLYFISDDKLWKSDGTTAGTVAVTNAYDSEFLVVFNNKLYFSGNGLRYNLMESDGTAIGTKQVVSLSTSSNYDEVSFLRVSQGKLFFRGAYKGMTNRELYVSDGTAAGTKFLKELDNEPTLSSNPRYFNDLNNKTIFLSDKGLWKTDGTSDSTVLIKALKFDTQLFEVPENLITVIGDKAYFKARPIPSTFNNNLWVTDGTANGTKSLTINTEGDIVQVGNKVFFSGDELNSYDPILDKVVEEIDINSGDFLNRSYPRGMINIKGILYFWADAGNGLGYELYKVIVEGPLTTSISQTATIKCKGDKTATIKVSTTAGISPFTYLWNTGATTAEVTGLGAGNYIVTVTGADSKTSISTITVTEPSAITLTTTSKAGNPQFKNGNAVVTASGGTAPYKYLWNTIPVQTTATAKNLVPGNYSATVTDANSCKAITNVTVTLSTSSNELWEKYHFEVFPNPVSDVLNIKYDFNDNNNIEVLLYDQTGRLLLTQTINSTQTSLNISDLPKGIYTLKCRISADEATTIVVKD